MRTFLSYLTSSNSLLKLPLTVMIFLLSFFCNLRCRLSNVSHIFESFLLSFPKESFDTLSDDQIHPSSLPAFHSANFFEGPCAAIPKKIIGPNAAAYGGTLGLIL